MLKEQLAGDFVTNEHKSTYCQGGRFQPETYGLQVLRTNQ